MPGTGDGRGRGSRPRSPLVGGIAGLLAQEYNKKKLIHMRARRGDNMRDKMDMPWWSALLL